MTIAPKTEKWFRINYGFNSLDKISIIANEECRCDLEKALYAQKFGEVVQIGNRQINGKYIISIQPDYHKYTGWYESYNPPMDGDDLQQIERDCPSDLDEIVRQKREKVDWLISKRQQNLIGKNITIPELENKEENIMLNPAIQKISDGLANKFKI